MSNVNKMTFSNDSWTNLVSSLSDTIQWLSGFANSGTAGYTAGGQTVNGSLNLIAKVTFSNDSRSNLGATLIGVSDKMGSHANSGTAGYMCGGSGGGEFGTRNKFSKLAFSNDSVSILSATLIVPRFQMGAMANSGIL
jgi:hypothetical protein